MTTEPGGEAKPPETASTISGEFDAGITRTTPAWSRISHASIALLKPEDQAERGHFNAGVIASGVFIPSVLTAAIATTFVAWFQDMRAVLVGGSVTSMVWVLAGFFAAGFTSRARANESSYRELSARVKTLGVNLKALDEQTSHEARPELAHPSIQRSLKQAREHHDYLDGLLT